MKKLLLGTSLALGLGLAGSAYSADLPMKTTPPRAVVAPPYSWTGFYIGGHFGGGLARKQWSNQNVDPDSSADEAGCEEDFAFGVCSAAVSSLGSHNAIGPLGGGQIGLNWQA